MKHKRLTLIFITSLIVTLALFPTATALANDQVDYAYSFEFPGQYVGTCSNGYTLVEDDVFDVQGRVFFDNDGNFIKLQEKIVLNGNLYFQEDPSKSVAYDPFRNNGFIDLKPTFTKTYTGITAKLTLPGYGNIFHDAGKIAFEWDDTIGWYPVFEAGQHQWWDQDIEEVCTYLLSQ
jgi:hypothetical protein